MEERLYNGEFVKTSKGFIGTVVKAAHYEIFLDGELYSTTSTEEDAKYITELNFDKSCTYLFRQNVIKLGNKEVEISSDKLTSLTEVSIMTRQGTKEVTDHVYTVSSEDATLLINIFQRNNVWYQILS